MKWYSYILIFFSPFILTLNAQDFSVGTWRDHLPYSEFNQVVEVGNFFYAASPYSLLEFDNSNNEINTTNIINILSSESPLVKYHQQRYKLELEKMEHPVHHHIYVE